MSCLLCTGTFSGHIGVHPLFREVGNPADSARSLGPRWWKHRRVSHSRNILLSLFTTTNLRNPKLISTVSPWADLHLPSAVPLGLFLILMQLLFLFCHKREPILYFWIYIRHLYLHIQNELILLFSYEPSFPTFLTHMVPNYYWAYWRELLRVNFNFFLSLSL